MQLQRSPCLDAKLSDICISTSAAPTYLPAHNFTNKDNEAGKEEEFNLIDGGVCANNPVRSNNQIIIFYFSFFWKFLFEHLTFD